MTDRPRQRRPRVAHPPVAKRTGTRSTPARNGSTEARATLPKSVAHNSSLRIIETADDISTAMTELAARCHHMAAARHLCSDPPLRRWSADFDGLARIIVGQQLSTASANAILQRLAAAVVPLDAKNLLATSEATLRASGLSTGKIATLRALAFAIENGDLSLAALRTADADGIRTQLTAIRGIGPWTADIYLLFCRGDADGFAAGDLALQIAAQQLLALPQRPSAPELTAIAERWRPWRGVAARMLWTYYATVKAKGIQKATV